MNSKRDKGHRYERKIATFYRRIGHNAKRGIQSRGGGAEVPDVIVHGKFWFVECKHYASGGLVHRTYETSKNDALPGSLVIVHTHEDDGAHLVTVSLDDWEKLMLQAQGRRHFKDFV